MLYFADKYLYLVVIQKKTRTYLSKSNLTVCFADGLFDLYQWQLSN